MQKIYYEGMLSALFFLIALIFLFINDFGILTIPGMISAILGIYLSLTGKYLYSACLGVIATFGSFLAQHIFVFCPYCTISATALLIGGVVNLNKSNNLRIVVGLVVLSALSLALLFINLPHYEQHPIITSSTKAKTMSENKALLYISPSCKGCRTIIEKFIATDPEGVNWRPVIVPAVSLTYGENVLREKGYKGEVQSAFSSPTRFVPLLEVNGEYYTGEQIEKIWREVGSD